VSNEGRTGRACAVRGRNGSAISGPSVPCWLERTRPLAAHVGVKPFSRISVRRNGAARRGPIKAGDVEARADCMRPQSRAFAAGQGTGRARDEVRSRPGSDAVTVYSSSPPPRRGTAAQCTARGAPSEPRSGSSGTPRPQPLISQPVERWTICSLTSRHRLRRASRIPLARCPRAKGTRERALTCPRRRQSAGASPERTVQCSLGGRRGTSESSC
jgi:hypothetical protein